MYEVHVRVRALLLILIPLIHSILYRRVVCGGDVVMDQMSGNGKNPTTKTTTTVTRYNNKKTVVYLVRLVRSM